MSEFYGWVQGNRGDAHRGGSKKSGIWSKIQSWRNSCTATLSLDSEGNDVLYIDFKSTYDKENLKVFINGEILKGG